jgi:hypothetical protein
LEVFCLLDWAALSSGVSVGLDPIARWSGFHGGMTGRQVMGDEKRIQVKSCNELSLPDGIVSHRSYVFELIERR